MKFMINASIFNRKSPACILNNELICNKIDTLIYVFANYRQVPCENKISKCQDNETATKLTTVGPKLSLTKKKLLKICRHF